MKKWILSSCAVLFLFGVLCAGGMLYVKNESVASEAWHDTLLLTNNNDKVESCGLPLKLTTHLAPNTSSWQMAMAKLSEWGGGKSMALTGLLLAVVL
ncbi:MAG: hypothetical protein HQL87_14575 [Magnetococcales bacterium]|nr:hypothetical protein [Magnetococcales bacterium]